MTEHSRQGLADIEAWLNRLDQALQPLPESEREDIVGETAAILRSAWTPARPLPSPVRPCRGLCPHLSRRLCLDAGARRPPQPGHGAGAVDLAGRSLGATLGLVGFVVFSATMLAALACILVKLIKPDLVGLWSGPSGMVPGIADHAGMHDVLGNKVYSVLVLLVVVDAVLTRLSLITAVKGVKGRETITA